MIHLSYIMQYFVLQDTHTHTCIHKYKCTHKYKHAHVCLLLNLLNSSTQGNSPINIYLLLSISKGNCAEPNTNASGDTK